jgi:hypothetical protein
LLRRRQWFFESTIDGSTVTSGRMLPEIMSRFRAAAPIIEFMAQPFVQQNKPRKLPFMAF